MAYPPRRPAASLWQAILLSTILLALLPRIAFGAYLNFENCLSDSVLNSDPLRLQFVPLYFRAYFDLDNPSHNLNITVFGNVSGQSVQGDYPPPDDPSWDDDGSRFGKINDVGSTEQKRSTLLWTSDLLTYTAYDAPPQRFCNTLLNGTEDSDGWECPLGPVFFANESDPLSLPAFTVEHDFNSEYSFGTLETRIRVLAGDVAATELACVTANITPDLGSQIKGLITWLPAVILIVKGVATLTAAIWSPWGSMDIFRWSSNYGRDEDLLRLVTPGFGDCLQYIQFVTLTGALTLQYPGFFQPAVSQTAWSLLLFNESFVSHEDGYQSLVDGVYTTDGTYGLTKMSQLIGMSHVRDMWACMAVWLLVIAVIVVVLCQLGFLGRWIYRKITDTSEEDLQSKNLPFTAGNMIRLLFNFFILPIVAISLFQLVVAPRSPTSVVVMAVILLLVMIVSAGWILNVIFRTKPRTILFDDMPTVLLYGPLYNTYSDSAAPFALIPAFITFMRGVAIGAVQPSGIAQIIVLAICEVILVLTLNAFRPFQGQTSMNAYHTFFACVRLVTILLSIAFVPNLDVDEASKGWIGYTILLLHACVLVFGFFLAAAQSIVEVILRSCGVAGDPQQGAIRGSILNMRMLKKRKDRPNTHDRGSMTSNAAILQDTHANHYGGGRSRSMSASSQQLLNQAGGNAASVSNRMSGADHFGESERMGSPDQEGFPAFAAGATGRSGGGGKGDTAVTTETFYRAPRQRRPTGDLFPPGAKSRESGAPPDNAYEDTTPYGGPDRGSGSDNPSPAPVYFRDRGFSDADEDMGPRPDYAVREVDQYYRGGALNNMPTRKLKTGPADPEGPAANAQSWFQRIRFGKKQKAKSGGGFEVVRSSRMPPGAGIPHNNQGHEDQEGHELQTSPRMNDGRYADSPQNERQAHLGAQEDYQDSNSDDFTDRGFSFGFTDGGLQDGGTSGYPHQRGKSADISTYPRRSEESSTNSDPHNRSGAASSKYPNTEPDLDTYPPPDLPNHADDPTQHPENLNRAPSLEPLGDLGGDFNLPSNFNSRHNSRAYTRNSGTSSHHPSTTAHPMGTDWLRAVDELDWNANNNNNNDSSGPGVPRKSSRRQPSMDFHPRGPGGAVGDEERPASFHVSKHKAGDSLHRNSLGAQAGLGERRAEFDE
ncbi:hypothetical protein MBLNU230_g7802t1 [Neophaeotheca triangularis]